MSRGGVKKRPDERYLNVSEYLLAYQSPEDLPERVIVDPTQGEIALWDTKMNGLWAKRKDESETTFYPAAQVRWIR